MTAEEERIVKLQQELLDADPAAIIANHAYGLFELAGLYLGATPPRLRDASFAIDAFAGLLSAVEDRLGDLGDPLQDGLRQLQAAFVQVAKLDHTKPDADMADHAASHHDKSHPNASGVEASESD